MSDHLALDTGPKKTPSTSFSSWGAVQTVISVAVIMASLLTLWTPANLFSNRRVGELLVSVQATRQAPSEEPLTPQPTSPPEKIKIGIVAGHSGKEGDPGAVCEDGLREVDVNLQIAALVRQQLMDLGYEVDLLEEFDRRLAGYQAAALVSIHNDSCTYYEDATGFKVAAAVETAYPEKAQRLTNCLVVRYQETTNMRYHSNTTTRDMTEYHTFNEVNASTPAAIIETGFLNLDREILTQQPKLVAQGIASGILCFLNNESISSPDLLSQ
ncbi:MAG: N-acetylmuramoyl-L-alanine amidase [Anaerolineaceae bacterium]|nr:N-acetylmuramoyl-L-alanine amidase [Anaerolineaceae bacterium]